MELAVRKFATFEEAEAADRAYYRSLTPAERLSIMMDPEGGDAASARFERVYRIVKLGES